ncbi:hypothetical protein JR316_0004257 [Psilocybe cubensis]|uniref:Uncharacterized protein n=2 Tax=Psilocybe cubensis TaxID=181762 RepID=A0ACB8H3C3_PSICU|nr:hypothetical protein JR316_0004257 [Psilocybe cubensis]KAH9482162.1 hypothetical protein JR316_0004257 [Psilocybe cubensis]
MVSSSASTPKELFVQRRKEFESNPDSASDIDAYNRRDDTHNYTVIKGFIPPPLVGKPAPGGKTVWRKSDTFFTDFKLNHPAQVLSETDTLYVIGNTASHDTRQYLAKWDPDGKDKTPSAGMAYVHLLVIPKKRIYNIVAMKETGFIDEMTSHFKSFWQSAEAIDKTTVWLETAVKNRAAAARKSVESHSPELLEEFDNTMQEVRKSAKQLNEILRARTQSVDELFNFYFHPAPDASIAHLHMHCVLKDKVFREFSTYAHDWKSVPVHDVKEVINSPRRCDETSTTLLWSWILRKYQELTKYVGMKGAQNSK